MAIYPMESPNEKLNMTTRKQHVEWCKERAFYELETNGPKAAIASLASDFTKHEDTDTAVYAMMCFGAGMNNMDIDATKAWIDGFN